MNAGIAALFVAVDSEGISPSVLAMLGVALGVWLFFCGFRMLRYKRLILNTPFSKIRSASIGLVEVSGAPTGPQTIAAAITGEPCYYYRARAWQYNDTGKGGKWAQVVDESLFVPFFLDDGTGKVLVNAQGAQLDVHRSFSDELGTSLLGKDSPVPESVRNFIIGHGLATGDKIRLEEHIIKPDFPLFVFGTLGENSLKTAWAAQPHASGAQISLGSGGDHSINLNFGFKSSGSDLAAKMMSEMITRMPGTKTVRFEVKSPPGSGPVVLPDNVVAELNRAGIQLPSSVVAQSTTITSSSVRSSVLTTVQAQATSTTEAAPPAAHTDTPVSATPGAATPGGFDLHASAAIGKGERGDPFTISSQSQREVVQSLAWKSMLMIWGGPVFALICLRFLLVYWQWM